jgi:pimeloyl-ACP methyl ester carboxylesterase
MATAPRGASAPNPTAHNGDVEIYHDTFGSPTDPALMLVNGFGSQCINFRSEWCEKFAAEGFHTIRFDNRDVGLSSKLEGVEYTIADMATDAVAVLDHLGIERAHVAGWSMGGMIVQTLAINHSDRLLSMTSVMSTTGDRDVGGASPEAMELLLTPSPPDRDGFIAKSIQNLHTWGSPAFVDEARIAEHYGEAYDRCFDPRGQARQLKAIVASGSRTEALRGVTTPALVIHGDADKLVDPSGGRRTAEAIPGARFELVAGMGHDYPPQLWDQLVQLITQHARAAG